MFVYPKNLYTDVRIENVLNTTVIYSNGKLDDLRERNYSAAFIRVYDGQRWYYSSTSKITAIQDEIDNLASLAKKNPNIEKSEVLSKYEVNTGKFLKFEHNSFSHIHKEEKAKLVERYFPVFSMFPDIKMWFGYYIDIKKQKAFYSSLGADLVHDYQYGGLVFPATFSNGKQNFSDAYFIASDNYWDLKNKEIDLELFLKKCDTFFHNARPVKPGKYEVLLHPFVTGVFAHESFGHKSEADFMINDETMLKEWALGRQVGSPELSIVDDGDVAGPGFVPYDDEGTKSKKIFLIKDGILSGRLHNAQTAASLGESVTGNARAVDFHFEPIVRMRTTYIMPGKKKKEELLKEINDGIYIETLKHGSGMSTFTIAPSIAYSIKNGRIHEPVNISVITGNVFDTLNKITGLSDEVELSAFVGAGCGKMEQMKLPVGFGGPYVRVKEMNVQ